jgi:TonB family protein
MSALASANLVAWAVQAGVVVAVAAPLPRLLRVWSPRVRFAFWRAVLVAILLLPLIQPWAVRPSLAPVAAMMKAAASATSVVGAAPASEPRAPAPAPASVPWRWSSPVALSAVLAAGVLLRLGWLSLGLFTLGRLRRSARPLEPRPPSIVRAAEMACADAEFLVSATASRPVTCGIRRPIVLVPRNFERFPECEQTAIACHELLHVRRADWTWNVADEVTRAVFWFHPGVWWLINEIQLTREQLVDREVVRRLGTKQPYLQALLRIARPVPRLVLTPASLFLKRAHLKQRVALLVKEGSMSKARLACAVLIMAVVVFIGGRLAVSAVPLQRFGEPQPVVSATAPDVALPQEQSRPGLPPQQATAPAWHSEAVRVGGTIRPPEKVVDVKAVYPAVAQAAKVQGVVICQILVGPDGKVEDARVLRSIPLLDQAALDAVRLWGFRPTLQNGNLISVVFVVTVNFTLQ